MNEARVKEVVRRVLLEIQGLEVQNVPSEDPYPDIGTVDIRNQYLVAGPHNREAFMALKEKTPARIGTGHTGARYRTATMLRFAADHAAAQAAVFNDVEDDFLQGVGWLKFTTVCETRDVFLTRPDFGRSFSPETLTAIKDHVGQGVQVVLYVADGLSSSAVLANGRDIVPVVADGLTAHGIRVCRPFFVQYGRVAAMDAIGDATGAEVVCVFLGERPGLVTADSMSAYLAYRPTAGMPESRRTVIANIHQGGTPAVEAGAHLVDLILRMLELKMSGTEMPME